MSDRARITVVGIGADGWGGLSRAARRAIADADEVIGSRRQLDLLADTDAGAGTGGNGGTDSTARRTAWPSPITPLVEDIVAGRPGPIAVLASGDPMHYGIGATLVRRLGPEAVSDGTLAVISQPSAVSLACAVLGWPAESVELVTAVGRPAAVVNRHLQPGRRVVVYVTGEHGASEVAARLVAAGRGDSALHVLENLGDATGQRVTHTTAAGWGERGHGPLATLAIEVAADPPGQPRLARVAGLPDAAYLSDGLLTKRHIRASTLALLAPGPGEHLWDIGAGSGSIAIEWLRAEPTATALAIEPDPNRAARIVTNASNLGTPQLDVRIAAAPAILDQLQREHPPDAIFIGGGLTDGVLDPAWQSLSSGGRIVANAVTIESEQILLVAQQTYGGELTKLSVSQAEPLGSLTAWRPALPVVLWLATKPPSSPAGEPA